MNPGAMEGRFPQIGRYINYVENMTRRADARISITLSRQAGCGALHIAERLAAILQARASAGEGPWIIFDKNLMEKVLRDHNLPTRLANLLPEDHIPTVHDWLEEAFGLHPQYEIVIHQSVETILKLAQLGNVILIGRASNVITARLPNVVRVRLVGSLEKRVSHIQEERHLTAEKAKGYVTGNDRARARYLRRYFHQQIENELLYDVIINTDRITFKEAAGLIADAVTNRKSRLSEVSQAIAML